MASRLGRHRDGVAGTTQARWSLEAACPASHGHAQIVHVEASQEPNVAASRKGAFLAGVAPRGSTIGAPWPGSGDYVAMPNTALQMSIRGACSSSNPPRACGCAGCPPPPGEYLRITHVEPAKAWQVEAEVRLASGKGHFEFIVDASREPILQATSDEAEGGFVASGPRPRPGVPGS